MADIICRWRNGTPKTVVELVNAMPHDIMPSEKFREFMEHSIYGNDFFHTPYQLACQLALYCEAEDGLYYPRFTHDITLEEAQEYLEQWFPKYYIPNPYVRSDGFNDIECPTYVVYSLYNYVRNHPKCSYSEAYKAIFHEEATNNNDIVKNYINRYSKVLQFEADGTLSITEANPNQIFKFMDRNNRKEFFDNFSQQSKRTYSQTTTTDNSSYLPYLTALRTKPFMLLAGISGTGKSRIVKELAFMTCPNEEGYNNDKTTPGNYCLIEVKPNWHDSSELLGYYNALDGKYELTPFIRFVYRALQRTDVPFFVCLDEMNLAPVEQYFAEYLSVLETRTKDGEEIISAKLIKKEAFNGIDVAQQYKDEDIAIAQYLQENGLPLPSNLYIVGTVNMDDTTHQFSRKVIDRAFTIEMNGGKLEDMFKPENANALQYRDKAVSMDLFKSHFVNATEVFKNGESDTPWTQYETKIKTDVPARLKAINDILKDTPFQVSYRVQNELILYLAYLIKETGFPEDIEPYIGEATLAILMEKILPRIQGDDKLLGRGQNKDVFTELSEYVEQTLMTRKTTDEQTKLVEGSDLYRKVIDKLDQMHKRLENSYFANFF